MHQPRTFMRQLVHRAALVVLAGGWWLFAAQPARAADEEHKVKNIEVTTTGGKELKLDLTNPKDRAKLDSLIDEGKVERFAEQHEINLLALRWDLGLWTIIVFLVL